MTEEIPKLLYRYFWDVNPKNIDLPERNHYVIGRLFLHGNAEAEKWLLENFSVSELQDVLKRTRDLIPDKATHWARILGVDAKEIFCLSEEFLQRRIGHWIT